MSNNLPFEPNLIDLELGLDFVTSKRVDLIYPHVYIEKKLFAEELDFLFKATNESSLNESNSMALYYVEAGEYELLGRLLVSGLSSILNFKLLEIPLYMREDEDSDPVTLTDIQGLLNFVSIIEL